jgi:hypothetical protein
MSDTGNQCSGVQRATMRSSVHSSGATSTGLPSSQHFPRVDEEAPSGAARAGSNRVAPLSVIDAALVIAVGRQQRHQQPPTTATTANNNNQQQQQESSLGADTIQHLRKQ